MITDPTTTLTREQLYERLWSTPMNKLIGELGTSRIALIQLCDTHQIPRPDRKYWATILRGLSPDRMPLPSGLSGSSPIAFTHQAPSPAVLVRKTIAQLGDDVPKIEVKPVMEVADIKHQNKQIWPEGGIMPYATPKMAARARAIENALVDAMAERGHQSGDDHRPGNSQPWFRIGGERIRYYLYEPDHNQRHYFTKSELKAEPFWVGGKGWEQRKVPSGSLKLGIVADYGISKLTWEDERGRALEDQLGEIIIAMEVVSAVAAKATAKRNEQAHIASIRTAEKERREHKAYLQDQRWERLCAVADGWHQAQRIRGFLAAFKETVAGDARLMRRAAKWGAWAEEYLWSIDPLPSDPEEVLRRLRKPKRRLASYEYEEDFY
ncbi:hypothetical protein [Asticcacaulis sp. 201]|uniref:hypothetical protein n=1 Tax=Asticcacaulis sp. 201 TaxID=3028787 RepID=UPI0029169C2D|nr:hypothetical protein [Asticcacaulis sp. 201]MDV6333140.1 hypothetical protein [Asticcacaulis sp. 201]